VVLFAVITFILFLTEELMLDWSAIFLVGKAGMIVQKAGIGYTVFSIAMTIGRFSGSFIIHRVGRRWTLGMGALLAPNGFVMAILLANPIGSSCGFALIGLGAANVVPVIFSLVSEGVPWKERVL
jgi:MFS family permease